MKFILFNFLYGFLWLISLLPLRLLFGISDLLYPFFYYLFPYRKKLVHHNLRNSFPEWDENQIKKVARRFYHYFFDLLIESNAGIFLSKNNMRKRYVLRNPELCNDLYDKGKSISLVMSHYGNWEWISITQLILKHQVLAIYKPLNNRTFDKLLKKSRERFGLLAVPMEKILRVLIDFESKKIPTLTLFLADQRPLINIIQYWLKFMNQETPVVLGPEKISKKMDMAVVYLKVIPIKRGYYEAEFVLLFEDSKNTAPYEITDRYHKVLEETIREKPEYWLWTHHRWKHKKEDFDRLFGNRKKIV
jgi:Kdo2-lipid IVA lauroyltransferase/acyltransferase